MTKELPTPETTQPTLEQLKEQKAQYIAHIKEQLQDLKVQVEYQELKARLAKATMEEVQYMTLISDLTRKPKEEDVEITEEMLKHNPEMEKEGLKIGDIITVSGNEYRIKK